MTGRRSPRALSSRSAAAAIAMASCTGACIGACTVGPDYHAPIFNAPKAYAEADHLPDGVADAVKPDLASWWTRLHDPVLNALIKRALAGNPDLAAAASRVREARQNERIAKAAAGPAVKADTSALTFNSDRRPSSALPIPSHTNLYSAGFDASWEIDVFGGTRRSVEAARANTAAADWARRDGQVSLVAEVANAYLSLRVLQARIALGREELLRLDAVFRLIRDRRVSGFVTDLDVNQQSVALATEAAEIPALTAQSKVYVHALGVLIGQAPGAFAPELLLAPAPPPLPPSLPSTLPSDLMQRRPDIREAESRMASASAQIGVQEAALFPKFNLLGLASFAGTSAENLFSAGNLASAALGMATQPIFDGGRARAAIAVAMEEHRQAQLSYEAKALSALGDVEDALARCKAEDARRLHLGQAVVAARSSLTIAEAQYQTGFTTYINVLQAQDALLSSRDQLLQSDGAILTDLVSLYKSLGGGWEG